MQDDLPVTSSQIVLDIDTDKHQLLADVATLYYRNNLTQAEIAEKLGVSRPSVSRLLREARDLGVVQITINAPVRRSRSLGERLKAASPVSEVHVITAGSRGYSQVVEALGVVAAQVLQRKLQDHMVLGISWNTGVYQVVRALQHARRMDVTVVQLTGSANNVNPLLDGPDLARWLADTLGGRYMYLPAPMVVPSAEVREALMQDRTIKHRLSMARGADLALLGIGSVIPPLCSMLQTGYITEEDLNEISALGGVGDILGTFYDQDGQPLDIPLRNRVVGLQLHELHDIGCVIGVAGGGEKAKAIAGALRGGYIDCLVTDDKAAQAIIDMID
ncbi:MAG: sugar-binding transcriptional regulator [Chloroflexota bacterium]